MGRSHLMRYWNVAAMWLALFGVVCSAQNPNTATYPTINDKSLLVASSGFDTTLAGNISASVLTLTVADASGLVTPGAIIIDFEIVVIASKVGNVLTVGVTAGSPAFPICGPAADCRGFDQAAGAPAATSHVSGAPVTGFVVAHHFNQPYAELIAIQAAILALTSGTGIACDGTPTELTVVAGAITITGSECFTVDTEADAASDDLDVINCTAGQRFKLTPADTTRTVVVKDDDVNIDIQADFSLNHLHDLFGGLCYATNVVIEEDRSNAGT